MLEMREVQAAARTLGFEVATLEVRRAEDIVPAFEALNGRADALYVCADPLVSANRTRINALALAEELPTMHDLREYAVPGGLMSYQISPICSGAPARNCQQICAGRKQPTSQSSNRQNSIWSLT